MIKDYFKGPVVLVARLILGGVFIYASIDKILNPGDFAKIINNYHVLPFGLENFIIFLRTFNTTSPFSVSDKF